AQLGGKPAPACGFAMGVERLIALIRDAGGEPEISGTDVYLVHQGEAATRLAFRVAENLRDNGIAVILHCGGGSFKSQMKKADGSGAPFAVVIGDDEAALGEVTLKSLREDGGPQQRVAADDLATVIIDRMIDAGEDE
ncbi:MAG TPA: His/Gly/Thr/Pro-type tRNA ligase C-terminal domain-containing protein, partial [Rhodocyclaceae bacterium]|nr:His/Gly/Thr/Pro-type tRNA ligase C-terminal domain-containing protein [Rhodocyclaceae bacterium]